MTSLAIPWICRACIRRTTQTASSNPLRTVSQFRRTYSVRSQPQDGRPFRMAVIGSGPAGFYTAYKVMSLIAGSVVDMYEHLPVPFGLVRFGVAPDHPEVKNCQEKFTEVANSPRFNFIGNVAIGEQREELPLRDLLPHYDAILFAYGASKDKALGIPGEETLSGIYSARAFVGWYNGLPEYANLTPNLSLGEEAIVVGQGNVALDVARILLQDVNTLKTTDIAEHTIEALQKSKVRRVRVAGRRGPLQAAFTIKEVREQMKLPSVAFHPWDESLAPTDIKTLPRAPRRIMEVLKKGTSLTPSDTSKSWSLDFCHSPISFNAAATDSIQLSSMTFEKTTLSPNPFEPSARAIGTGENVTLPSNLAFRSIGYKSEPLPGFEELDIPFDTRRGIIPNDHLGRVINDHEKWSDEKQADPLPGVYCAGWVKRGPTGVIASTMNDAFATAESIAEDWYGKKEFLNKDTTTKKTGWEGLKELAEQKGLRRVSWEDWKRIDGVEKVNGAKMGKEREKFTRIEDMLAVLD